MRRSPHSIPRKSIALLAVSALSLVSCGSGSTSSSLAITASGLLRSWRYVGNDGGIQKEQHLRFDASNLTNTIICRFPDGSAPQAVVTSPIQLMDANRFRITESHASTANGSVSNCDASLTAGDYTYTIGPVQNSYGSYGYGGYGSTSYPGTTAGSTQLTLTAISGTSGTYTFTAE